LTDKQLKFPRIIPVVLLWDHSYDFTQETINQEGSRAQQKEKGRQGTEGCCSYVRVKQKTGEGNITYRIAIAAQYTTADSGRKLRKVELLHERT
jgi:hypothetical protein